MNEIFLIFGLAATQLCWAQSKKEQQVATAVQQFHKAIIAMDSSALVKRTSTNLSYGHSSGALESKDVFVRNVLHGPFKFVTIDAQNQTITIVKRTAIVRHIFFAKANNNGVPTDIKIGVLQVWQKEKASWKLLARQAYKL
ncbi:MAG TPA: nuclear transport factor 2 family protein [Chitinophagaceae bacterium]|nr:nuclear transport factor 2 family protein [Chitinophagaceae bacterium]